MQQLVCAPFGNIQMDLLCAVLLFGVLHVAKSKPHTPPVGRNMVMIIGMQVSARWIAEAEDELTKMPHSTRPGPQASPSVVVLYKTLRLVHLTRPAATARGGHGTSVLEVIASCVLCPSRLAYYHGWICNGKLLWVLWTDTSYLS